MTLARDRFPSTQDSLRSILASGVEIESVIDVGVHTGTPKLARTLPDALHVLIEPSAAHTEAIEKNYRSLRHELHHVALGDRDDKVWMVDVAIDEGESVTHSRIVANRTEAEATPNLRSFSEIPLRRLDTLMKTASAAGPILLKIDVDGNEIPVLEGAPNTLARTSVVCIEAPLYALAERVAWLEAAGFRLFDIVDLDYYKGALWQVDLVFLSAHEARARPRLTPDPNDGRFDPSQYRSLRSGAGRRRWWQKNRR